MAALADLLKNDHRIVSRMLAESLNIQNIAVFRSLKEDLGSRNLFSRFVPYSLTPKQREDRVSSCQNIIAMANEDKMF